MQEFKVSYILTKSEVQLLLSCVVTVKPAFPARYILEESLAGSIWTGDDLESLVSKKMAHKESGKLIIEPVIELIVKSILFMNRLWIVNCMDMSEPILIVGTHHLFLLITHYTPAAETWKITLYPNAAELKKDNHDILSVVQITTISDDGRQQIIKPDGSFNWLEEDHYGENFC